MQKLVNFMAVIGFLVSIGTIGVGSWAYMNRATFVQQLVETLCMQLEPLLKESVREIIPEQTILPLTTGPAIKID